jgi:septum formation protein
VITGVVVLKEAERQSFDRVERVRVTMRAYTDAEIETYVATGDPLDKAGAYSLQGAGRGLLAGLDGDYLAAVGLPLRAVAEGLRAMGVPVACDLDRLYRERAFLNWKTFEP